MAQMITGLRRLLVVGRMGQDMIYSPGICRQAWLAEETVRRTSSLQCTDVSPVIQFSFVQTW